MGAASKLLFLMIVAVGIFLVLRPRPVFVVRIKRGHAHVTHGSVAGPFLEFLEDVCRDNGIARGSIFGVVVGRRTALRFSRNIPGGCRQQLRNGWTQGA